MSDSVPRLDRNLRKEGGEKRNTFREPPSKKQGFSLVDLLAFPSARFSENGRGGPEELIA
jgi:hypothetical protein